MRFPLRLPFLCSCVVAVALVGRAQAQIHYEAYRFVRLAGSAPGSDDGVGKAARFFDPESVAVDATGNVYVADYVNNTIRKITPLGVVSTLAGVAGVAGTADGPVSTARFRGPIGVAVDNAGNVYVSEGKRIRKITAAGIVSTLAGSLSLDFGDGEGTAAGFDQAAGLAVDSAGNIYVADFRGDTIRKVTPSGTVTTLAGSYGRSGTVDGMGADARFHYPNGLAVDRSGNVYVADGYSHAIRKITPGGLVSTVAGLPETPGATDGVGNAARFNFPMGVAVDATDNVYVSDTWNHTIRKLAPDGTVTTVAGVAGSPGTADGTGSAARFDFPGPLAFDAAGNLYVPDGTTNTIRKITAGGVVTTFAGLPGYEKGGVGDGPAAEALFTRPAGVAVDPSGNVYVADTVNETVRKIMPNGVVTTLAGLPRTYGSADGAGSAARFYLPQGIAVDPAGNVFVADTDNATIRKITPAGTVTTLAGTAGNAGYADGSGPSARFNRPVALAVDPAGNLYVADLHNDAIRKVTPDGVVTTFLGGPNSHMAYAQPSGVAVDKTGNVYLASNMVVFKVTPDGIATRLAGSTHGWSPTVDGTGPKAYFNAIGGLAVDGAGNVFVTENTDFTVRKITPAGVVTTLAGWPLVKGNAAGTGSAARFDAPQGVAVDEHGNVYVAAVWDHAIWIGNPATRIANLSTRLAVETGDNVLIGGFIITGADPVRLVLRGIGPSLAQAGISGGALADPTLELYDSRGALLASNDDWRTQTAGGSSLGLETSGLAPSQDAEAAIMTTLTPGAYTTVIRGKNNSTGVALVEAYDLDLTTDSKFANISTRGFVQSGDNVMIGGIIVKGTAPATVLFRAIGPTLAAASVPNSLQDPILELHNSNGDLMNSNDNWAESAEIEIEKTGLAPASHLESAILSVLPTGAYTAVVRGKNGSAGAAVVEMYCLDK
jgi:sugar lactone lactonase YvrE